MAPRKSAKSLLDLSLERVKVGLITYIRARVKYLTFTEYDVQANIDLFKERARTGMREADQLFQGSLRLAFSIDEGCGEGGFVPKVSELFLFLRGGVLKHV